MQLQFRNKWKINKAKIYNVLPSKVLWDNNLALSSSYFNNWISNSSSFVVSSSPDPILLMSSIKSGFLKHN